MSAFMRRIALAAPLLVAIAGCGHLITSTASTDSDFDVCERFGRYSNTPAFQHGPLAESYFQETQKRQLLTAREYTAIRDRKIGVGMSECALIASWGRPTIANRSVSRYGVRVQYVYRSPGYYVSSARYVYTEDGRVTSWQD
jgi:hypothetical protein